MRRMLVTGGAGFIGTNFVHYWFNEHSGDRLVVIDALTYAGNLSGLQRANGLENFRFVHGSVCDGALIEKLLREERIDTIVHFAAESHVDRSIRGAAVFVETNIVGTYVLLEAARKVWLDEHAVERHRFHHISTDEVYGSLHAGEAPFHEHTPYAPRSPYAATKAASDHLVRCYHHTYGMEVTTSNCSNNYGPYQLPEKLIPLMIVNALHGRVLPIYGDGLHRRDWLHVADHCRGIDLILHHGEPGATYNIGGGCEAENLKLVHLLCRVIDETFQGATGLEIRFPQCPAARGVSAASLIRFISDRPGHDRRYAVDCRRIEQDLGYKARGTLEEGLRDTVTWYVQNEWWWRSVMDETYDQWIQTHYRSNIAASARDGASPGLHS
jgi:dTDP-glucose 4,6-dehydratase